MSESMVPDTGARAVDLFIRWSDNELDEVRRDFDTTMLDRLTEAALAEAWRRVVDMVGEYRGVGESVVRVLADFTVVDVQLRFEDGPMMGRVAYDSDGRIAGLFILFPAVG